MSLFVSKLIITSCARISINAIYILLCMYEGINLLSIQVGRIHFTSEFQQFSVDLLET